ncbi:hypothetical protein F8388_018360 [Cannabis sativa]|uniref:CCHC-type domain-containing protein n=1 Tax=Cannabis sativa TaxID=3483 RepID=A0A7J6HH75_CANSA|nr:hypothetical protein F8388_018360 [Cannabis sativa]
MLKKPIDTVDDLLAKVSNLTVLDEDGWEINTVGGSVVGEHCAKARLCSNRPMSRPLLKTILGRVWGVADNNWGVEIKFNNNKSSFLVFSFKSAQDLNRILNKCPWLLNYGTLILERMENLPCDWKKELLRFPISGRVLHLPSRSITKGNLVRLATMAGEVIEVQPADIPRIVTKGYFTFKVWCDITKPLFPGFLFPSEGKKIWLPFRYDRLPFMCFNCGFLGHDTRVCAESPKMFDDGLGNWKPSYGPWLKVDDKRDAKLQPNAALDSSVKKAFFAGSLVQDPPLPAVLLQGQGLGASSIHSSTSKNMLEFNSGLACTDTDRTSLFEKDVEGMKAKMQSTSETVNVNSKRRGFWREDSSTHQSATAMDMEVGLNSLMGKESTESSLNNLNLIDVPITYEDKLGNDTKVEGPLKRRKVTPKRIKNKGKEGMTETKLKDYFQHLFSQSNGGTEIKEELRGCVPCRINPWLPRGTPFSLRSKVSLPEGVTIDKLINEEGTWKNSEVSSWFHVDDIPWVLAPNVLFSLWGKLSKSEMLYFIGFSWLLWHRRNKFLFQHKVQEDHAWVNWAQELLDEHFGEVFQIRSEQEVCPKRSWQPPPPDHVLINTDASVVQGKPGCGLSAVIRDHDGNLIVAESFFIPGLLSVQLAEVYAIRMGLMLAQRWSLKKVHVAADCLGVVSALQSSPTSLSDWGMMAREIQMLQKHFTFVQFSFVHRECNDVANALAIWSRKTHSCNLWTVDLPDCAAAILLVEKPLVAV